MAIKLYNKNEAEFWARWFDPTDNMLDVVPALVMDGAHRYTVCNILLIAHMRSNMLRPTISITEMVQLAQMCNRCSPLPCGW
jgi:hypothetical protein